MAEPTRVHHPPDQIINGKPKWTEIIVNKQNEETELNIDRLNPSRNMLEEIESACEERAEDTQKVLVNMMSDLKCELLVTLGDAKLDLATEQKFMEKHDEWENYKRKHNITEWKPSRKPRIQVAKKPKKSKITLEESRVKPCRVMLKKVKVEEKDILLHTDKEEVTLIQTDKEKDNKVNLMWKNILGGQKRTFSEMQNGLSSKKKGLKKKRKSEFVKAKSALLSWVTENSENTNPNITI